MSLYSHKKFGARDLVVVFYYYKADNTWMGKYYSGGAVCRCSIKKTVPANFAKFTGTYIHTGK